VRECVAAAYVLLVQARQLEVGKCAVTPRLYLGTALHVLNHQPTATRKDEALVVKPLWCAGLAQRADRCSVHGVCGHLPHCHMVVPCKLEIAACVAAGTNCLFTMPGQTP
jgi:hypothetical protein